MISPCHICKIKIINKTPKPILFIKKCHGHAKEFLGKLSTIWARALKKRSPALSHVDFKIQQEAANNAVNLN
jgi:hypothetical protein